MSDENTKITIKTLAEKLGLSIATVDRALNKRGNVRKETYDRIMKAVEELNYSPNKSASFLSKGKQVTIAAVFQTYPSYFWDQIESGIDRIAKEIADYGLRVEKIRTVNNDVESQMRAIEDVIESGKYDGIAVSSDGSYELAELIDHAISKGIPTCTFNTDSPLSKRLFYVGADYRDSGKLAAELLCKFLGGKGTIAFVLEKEYMFQFKEKVLGFREVLEQYSGIRMTGPLKINRDHLDETISALEKELSEVDGIYLASGELDLMAKHVERWGLNVRLIGHDMTDNVYHYLQKDIVTATICQEPENQGYVAIKQLFEVVTGQIDSVPSIYRNKLEIVTRENAKFYL